MLPALLLGLNGTDIIPDINITTVGEAQVVEIHVCGNTASHLWETNVYSGNLHDISNLLVMFSSGIIFLTSLLCFSATLPRYFSLKEGKKLV